METGDREDWAEFERVIDRLVKTPPKPIKDRDKARVSKEKSPQKRAVKAKKGR